MAATTMRSICLLCGVPHLAALAFERWIWPRLEETEAALPVQTSLWAAAALGEFRLF